MSEKAKKDDRPAVDLKALKEERKEFVEAATESMKTQTKEINLIKKALAGGARTVPEMAAETGLAAEKVMFYIATMVKYGQVKEADRQGSYFRYELSVQKADKEE